jgi:two-component system OmpR family response regulator
MRILVAESDVALGAFLEREFRAENYAVDLAQNANEAKSLVRDRHYDAAVLDLHLPEQDGFEVLRCVRAAQEQLPILILASRARAEERVQVLDLGADDLVFKPFAFAELSARLRALGRRGAPGVRRAEPVLQVGPIAMDEASHRVTVKGRVVELSPREYSLLECFLRHPGQALSRDQLLDHAWPFGVAVTPNAVDAYVHYQRDKLGPAGDLIRTVRGVGYRLADG